MPLGSIKIIISFFRNFIAISSLSSQWFWNFHRFIAMNEKGNDLARIASMLSIFFWLAKKVAIWKFQGFFFILFYFLSQSAIVLCTYSGLIWVKIRYELLVPGEDKDTIRVRAESYWKGRHIALLTRFMGTWNTDGNAFLEKVNLGSWWVCLGHKEKTERQKSSQKIESFCLYFLYITKSYSCFIGSSWHWYE